LIRERRLNINSLLFGETMRSAVLLLSILVLSGCTSVAYNGMRTYEEKTDFPEIGKEVTAYVGDYIINNGVMIKEDVLHVYNTISDSMYHIPPGKYLQLGYTEEHDFFTASGVAPRGLADPAKALAVKKPEGKLCVISIFDASSCVSGEFEIKKVVSSRSASFEQTLIYSGRVGNNIKISYREFGNQHARPAFSNDVEYDLTESSTFGYKGATIEVINADNKSITYKVVEGFKTL
jgi:hypothetical protein